MKEGWALDDFSMDLECGTSPHFGVPKDNNLNLVIAAPISDHQCRGCILTHRRLRDLPELTTSRVGKKPVPIGASSIEFYVGTKSINLTLQTGIWEAWQCRAIK